ncbi:MAG: hypothetical protein EAZ59_11040 [Oscillatoriales cyanobacterium]|nr:MAG: hypothetical protein EAZ59_11040 [Oscillatoriales cyanobacterium]
MILGLYVFRASGIGHWSSGIGPKSIGVNNRLKSFVSFVYRRLQDPPRIPTPPLGRVFKPKDPPSPP